MAAYRTFAQHLDPKEGPKRILSLDGGGLRGMMTVHVLKKIETLLRDRFGDPDLRLCNYFDLIAGTSTGAIIAEGLSKGMTVKEIEDHYRTLGDTIFKRSFWRRGVALENDAEDADYLANMQEMDRPENLDRLARLGAAVAEKQVDAAHFPEAFDAGVSTG